MVFIICNTDAEEIWYCFPWLFIILALELTLLILLLKPIELNLFDRSFMELFNAASSSSIDNGLLSSSTFLLSGTSSSTFFSSDVSFPTSFIWDTSSSSSSFKLDVRFSAKSSIATTDVGEESTHESTFFFHLTGVIRAVEPSSLPVYWWS